MNVSEIYTIQNTSKADLANILWLFEEAISLQGKNGYKVWSGIDILSLEHEIKNGLQYKMVKGGNIVAVFSVLQNDPFIWGNRDQNDAIYLHRIVVHPDFKGKRLFELVLNWARQTGYQKGLTFIRMDTWADNTRIIEYYKSFGFRFVDYFSTPDARELPIQNRNLNVALLELALS